MQFHEFLGLVQHHAELPSSGDAMRASRAFLQVLGQRLYGGEAGDIASQLPHELQSFLMEADCVESFDLDEFYQRVALREGVDLPVAIRHARAVMKVLVDALSPGEVEDMLAQLPDNYDDLFTWGISDEDIRRAS